MDIRGKIQIIVLIRSELLEILISHRTRFESLVQLYLISLFTLGKSCPIQLYTNLLLIDWLSMKLSMKHVCVRERHDLY